MSTPNHTRTPGESWTEAQRRMFSIVTNPLVIAGYNSRQIPNTSTSGEKGKASAAAAKDTIKIQKKGVHGAIRVSIARVTTWRQLLELVPKLFPPSTEGGSPEIVTFEGDLLRSAEEYKNVLKPGLRLVVSYPADLGGLVDAFGDLGREALECGGGDDADAERFQLLPPSLFFYTAKELRVLVTMANSSVKEFCEPGLVIDRRFLGRKGVVLPPTLWDVWASNAAGRKQVLVQRSLEFTATPGGEREPAVVTREGERALRWAVHDQDAAEGEKRVYAYCEGAFERQGWWMADLEVLTAPWEPERCFLLEGLAHAQCFLTAFLEACGVGPREVKDYATYWTDSLRSACHPADKVIVVKFLTPKEMRTFLPLTIDPYPDWIVRVFAVFRVLPKREVKERAIRCEARFARQVEVVMDKQAACKGGDECVHGEGAACFGGFELGGARALGDWESVGRQREVTPGLVVGEEELRMWRAEGE
ncbi:hypothetical protein FN846DRAFT_891338 [Sphaerosporella brunnea]|uniref:Uncharacterized protein n=1 Tax=Sphaerosporella brunnea TaxID=1250544 RepID=A0A5J5ETA5_9PEZI|nr:hypothetical protein FN846DRAFT_891338 [Sphaerosporella brunnea]